MPESAQDAPEHEAARPPDTSGATSGAPTTPTTPKTGAGQPRSLSLGVLAIALLAMPAIAVMLLAGRPGTSQDSPAAVAGSAASASRAVTPAPPAAVEAGPGAEPAAKWTGSRPGWATDGSRTISFGLDAESDVPVWMNRVRPVLTVRCFGRSTEVFVITGSAASFEDDAGGHTVRVGFDAGADVEQHWIDSSDYRALFAPDGEALARQIAQSTRMRFAFTPYNSALVVTEFDVRGFERVLESMARSCRRKW